MINNYLKTSFLVCLLIFSRHSFAIKPPQKIVLDQYVEEAKGKKMQSVIPVYKYAGMPMEDPVNNGLDTKKPFGYFTAKLPDMKGYKDTNYFYLYFGALSKRKDLQGYTLGIVANNGRQYGKLATIWIDKNHNLDLSDDGPPQTLDENIGYLEISLSNPDNPQAKYSVYISRFEMNTNATYKNLMDQYYELNSGTKKYVTTEYSFREQRINTIAGDYKDEYDSFRLAIKDVNCNGLYNEGNDYIIIGDYKTSLMPDNKTIIESKAGKTAFERNGKRYIVTEINAIGNYIMIQEDEGAKITKTLVVGKKLKKFKFKTPDKEQKTISIRQYRKKATYIYVWNFNQDGFSKDTSALRIIARDYANKIQLITLNYGETPKELRAFMIRNNINWNIGLSSQKINEQLFLEKYPFAVLTEKRLKIKQLKISPEELLLLLKNNQI
jgi:hypothetical protein